MSEHPKQNDGARHLLRVKNLPGVLSSEAVASLLAHYGATDVKLLKDASSAFKAKRAPQTAIAMFRDGADRESAFTRLSKLQLAGHQVRAERIAAALPSPPPEEQQKDVKQQQQPVEAPLTEAKPAAPPLPKGPPPPLPPPAPPVAAKPVAIGHSYYAPAPLAPHLGLHFAPSPLLEYKYPRASESIVRNIANALIALPKFYTQVLHLMNKMNLPPPFDERAIPGIFSKDCEEKAAEAQRQKSQNLKRKFPGAQPPAADFRIEEEEEEEDDNEDEVNVVQTEESRVINDAKKQRVQSEDAGKSGDSTALAPAADPVLSLPKVPTASTVASVHPSKVKRSIALSSGIAKAFGTAGLGKNRAVRPGVISEAGLDRQRISLEDLNQNPIMAEYDRGDPSRTLFVQNLAETVDEQDLAFVFGHVLPLHMELSALQIEISSASKTATIVFPTEALAALALDKAHGVALETLPLIVSYKRREDAEDGATASGDTPRPSTLSVEELDSRRLEPSAFAGEKFMKNYQRGEPSATLYVKNLAKDIDERDLRSVFGAVVPDDMSLSAIKIRHFTEGRMKYQAFVEYPSVFLAVKALEKVHGVVFKEKLLVVVSRPAYAESHDRLNQFQTTHHQTLPLLRTQCFRKPPPRPSFDATPAPAIPAANKEQYQ